MDELNERSQAQKGRCQMSEFEDAQNRPPTGNDGLVGTRLPSGMARMSRTETVVRAPHSCECSRKPLHCGL